MNVEYHYRDRRTRRNCIEVINLLDENGPLTIKELARYGFMGYDQAKRAVKKLERDNRIESEPHPEDARKTIYTVPKSSN